MSIGVALTLFFASVEAGSTFVKIGITSSPITAMCRPTASIWLVPKFSSFDQMSFTLTGRSVRNCFRFDQKLSGMRRSGFVNFGTADVGTGTAGPRPAEDTLGFVISGGSRLMNLPGTVYLFSLDASFPSSVYLHHMIRAGW